jgi:hypothetical protein
MPRILEILAFVLCVVLAIWVFNTQQPLLVSLLLPYGYLAAFIGGLLYSISFASPFSIAIFLLLNPYLGTIQLSLLGGAGATISDLFLINVVKVVEKDISKLKTKGLIHRALHSFNKLLRSANLHFLAFIIGAFFIASPLPNEFGIIMLDESKLSGWQLVLITYLLSTAGIFIILHL